jgi:ABC-type polar amino acid transport system ATPase subunit
MAAHMKIENPTTPHVRVVGITKSYGGAPVLDNLSIDIAMGEVLVLCGPSGCGKSTLLRCINGLEEIQGGELWVGDIRVDKASPEDLQRVRVSSGLVFQNFNLFPHMRIIDNITIAPIKIKGMARKDAEQQAQALLESVGIPEKAQAWPFELSGGQRQRVAIARALAMQPTLMLFDEPTSALDPEMREEVMNVIRRLHEERGLTMVVVTHEIGFAKAVAHRAIMMEKGKIVEEGPARSFFTNPSFDRTKRFLRAIIND